MLEVLANTIRQEEKINGILIWKEEIKVSLFTDNTIINFEYQKELSKKKKNLRKLISNDNKGTGYKINTKRPLISV